MKKLFSFSIFLLFAGLASAQCPHAGKTCQAGTKASAAALKAAEADPTIEKKVCAGTDMVCFKKKSVDAATGAVSYADVKYDEGTASFVNFVPEKTEMKACCKAGASNGKSCCAKGGKTCSKEKGAGSNMKAENPKQ